MENNLEKINCGVSVHHLPHSTLQQLLSDGCIEFIDPGDGEPGFYIFTPKFGEKVRDTFTK